jgi:hypothetical protein
MNEADSETISRLKFIGRLKKGERIDVTNVNVMRPSIFTSIYRTLINRDSRRNTLYFIRDTVSSAFVILDCLDELQHMSDVDSSCLKNLIADIRGALVGIQSIKCTYSTDSKFCCDLETVEQMVATRLSKFS